MPSIGSVWVLAGLLAVPPSVERLSPLDRQRADFTGAIGRNVSAAWRLTAGTARVGGDLTVSLVVRGAANPTELDRPAVEFAAADFQLLDAPPPPRVLPDGVAFDFRLRCVRPGTATLPAVPFAYYRPDRPPGRHVLTTYVEALPLGVTPAETPPPPPARLPLFAAADDRRYALPIPVAAWLLPPLVTVPAAVLIRRGTRRRQTSSADLALARLRQRLSGAAVPDIHAAVLDFLRDRHGLPAHAQTPAEVASLLPDLTPFHAVLTACDAAQFSTESADAGMLRESAWRAAESGELLA